MEPYYFTPSQWQATSVAEFLAVCQAEPQLAASHLQEGYFEPWLRDLGRQDLAEAAAQMRLGGNVTRQQLREFVQAALDNEARRASTRTGKNVRASAGHMLSAVLGAASLSVVGLTMSCTPPAPTAGPNPTVPSAQQGVATGTAGAPTVQSAQTAVSTLGVATRITPTVAAARTQIPAAAATAGTSVTAQTQIPAAAATAGTSAAGAQTQIPAAAATAGTGVAGTRTQIPAAVATGGTSAAVTGATPPAQQATDVTVAREGTARALAPTAQAVATLVAPTMQATATQVVAAVGTSVAASPIHVTDVNVAPTDTIVSIQNAGTAPMTLSGWTLLMGPGFSIQLSDIPMKAGQTRKLHFSQGTDTDSDVFLGAGYDVGKSSLQSGTRVVLIAPSDQIASVYPIM